jgi:primary-amine oxidase
MSLQIDTPPPTMIPQKQVASHCIAPLTGDEISNASSLVKALYPSNTSLQFKVVTLQEPPKVEVLRYLEAEHSRGPLPAIERKAFVNYYIRNTV